MVDWQAIYEIAKQVERCDPDFILWTLKMLWRDNPIPPLTEKPSEYWLQNKKYLIKIINMAQGFYPSDHPFIQCGQQLIKICENNAKGNYRIWKTENGRLFENVPIAKRG